MHCIWAFETDLQIKLACNQEYFWNETERKYEMKNFLNLTVQLCIVFKTPEELQEVRSKLKRGASEAPGEALRLCAGALQRILANSGSEMEICDKLYFDVAKLHRVVP